MKRSLVVAADGGPLGLAMAGANVHATKLRAETLEALVVERPKPTAEAPQHLCWEKGDDHPTGQHAAVEPHYTPHMRRIGEENAMRADESGILRGDGWWTVATYNTPIQTDTSYPIIDLSGLLNLVAVLEKFRPQAVEEKGSLCQLTSSPPAPRSRRAHPGVDTAARRESPTPPVAAQPAAGAPAERCSAGGGQ